MASSYPSNPEPTHACQQTIGYTFQDPTLLWEALQADGSIACLGATGRFESGNKRLAIVGDRVLDLMLSLKWYPTWQDRETFTTLRHSVTSNNSLEAVARLNRLDSYITLAPGAMFATQKTLTATVEAIVGAAYLDGGMDAATMVVRNLGVGGL